MSLASLLGQAFAVAGKELKEALREPQIALLFLILPAFFIFSYYLAYGQIGSSLASWLKVVAVDLDGGPRAASVLDALESARFEGSASLDMRREGDPAAARALLAEGRASLLILLPRGFGDEGRLVFERDPRSDTAAFAETIARACLEAGSAARIETQFLSGTGTANDFQLSVPGLLVFGATFGVLTQALLLVRESSRGTIARLRMSPLRASGFFAGFSISSLAWSAAQAAIAWLAALACGFGAAGGVALPILVILVYSLAASGCGLLTACMTSSETGAATVCMVFIGPLAFLSGAVFPLPPATLFEAFGRRVALQDLLPSTHAVTALTDLMIYGRAPSAYSMAGLSALAAALLVAGSLAYRGARLRAY
jgi:ABC-type multidrug transport system permease subunit